MTLKIRESDWTAEADHLASVYPALAIEHRHDGNATCGGVVEVLPEIGYTVGLRVPDDYPRGEPVLICNRREIPWELDRHVHPHSGAACLCARMEIRRHWPYGSDLTDWIQNLVIPFFLWQHYFDTHGVPPPSGARSHGRPGIIEAAKEMLSPIGQASEKQIRDFLLLLARKNDPKGHEICPCGSGLKLRNCHADFLRDLRVNVDPGHAMADLEQAFGTPQQIFKKPRGRRSPRIRH